MTNVDEQHELDDVLQHYGVKGMKWGVRRSDAELELAEAEGVGGGGLIEEEEDEEGLFDKLFGDMFNMFDKSLSDLGDSFKDAGMKALQSIFGKSEKTYKPAVPDKNSPFKNPRFQREYAKHQAAIAKIDKLERSGSISAKDAKRMRNSADEKTKNSMKSAEKFKNVKVSVEDTKIEGNTPSKSTKTNSSSKPPKTVTGAKQEAELDKWLKDNGYKEVKSMTKAEREAFKKSAKGSILKSDQQEAKIIEAFKKSAKEVKKRKKE
jgi:hypothetical protein